jgi:transposase-like protein
MLTKRRTFDKQFKLMIFDLINSGQKVSKVSVDYGLNDAMIRRWQKEFSNPDRPSFTGKGVIALSPEEKETRQIEEGTKRRLNGEGYLEKGRWHLLQDRQELYTYIEESRDLFPVERMCNILKVSKNTFYNWLKDRQSERKSFRRG